MNKEIADILDNIASLLSINETPSSRFEVRAYQKASLTVRTLQEDVEDIYKKGGTKALMELPGVGKSIASHIEEYIKTGKIQKYEEFRKRYPFDIGALTSIEGLGAKRAIVLYKKLGIKNIADLKKAIESQKIRALDGFGIKSEESIKKGISYLEAGKGRMLLGDALPVAESIIKKLKESGLVEKVMIAGSARRMRETVGDLDILAISEKSGKVMDFFTKMTEVSDIIAKGPTKSSVILKIGINCDFRVVPRESFGAAIVYFTGNRDHNIEIRTLAINKGYKLNEYGIYGKNGKIIPAKDEEEIYQRLGMQWMPPEMREDRGEVKLSLAHKIPEVVDLKDMKGDLHTHTNDSDGANTIDEMADAAMKFGHEYFATTNHTKSLSIARGMNEKGFENYFKRVDKLNDRLDGKIRILKGAEVDILKDGSLDLAKDCISKMDCVVASVHSYFKMQEDEMTKRIMKALDTGLVDILGHPTGRQINEREPYPVDLERVFETAERNNVAMEINSYPNRLDLGDTNIMKASKYKLKFSIDTDSHRTPEFVFLRYGVATARRGWLAKDRVINAMPLKELLKLLSK